MNLLSSLNISQGALSVNEKAISVVSHNVANMNTEGYHKQRVNLAARNIAGQIGDNPLNQVRANGGVMIANVMRYNDDYLNNYYRQQLAQRNMYEQQLGNLDDLANIFNDLDGTGIDSALSDFYDALNNLNQYPASSTARANFIERAKSLASIMNSKSVELSKLTGQALGTGDSAEALANSRIYAQYRDLNNSLEELAAVNKALQTTQTGTLTANNLLDKRDLILHDISQYLDITVDEKQNGTVNVYVGDVPLVKGSTVTGSLEVQTAKDYCANHEPPIGTPDDWSDIWYNQMHGEAAVISIVDKSGDSYSVIYDNANGIIQGGALGGLIHSATDYDDGVTNAGTVQAALDTLASTIADVFNTLNTREGAYCINPNDTNLLTETNANNTIFQSSDGGPITAANITISDNLRSNDGIWNIACAYFENEADRPSATNPDAYNAVGNAFNVVDMMATRNAKQGGEMKGMSFEDFYSNILGKVASAGDTAKSLYETQCDVVDSLENQLDSAYGVDLNEELVDLVKYQTAYAAAAQVFNTVNACLDTLMTLGR
ncbi:flagellar hook-associated protein FlgK [bacterium]|nr:flagellar hook-associated protein FlgK [bacterium]